MAEVLRAVRAIIEHDDRVYDLVAGPIPEDTPEAVIETLRENDALLTGDEDARFVRALSGAPSVDAASIGTGGAEGEPDPDAERTSQTGAPGTPSGQDAPSSDPPDAPDVESASVEDIAQYIDQASLTAPQTVALARSRPDLAAKVLEAERVSSGGDPRAPVRKPLERLASQR